MVFEEVFRAARLMSGFSRPWFIAGGWAIDLFLGRITRPHQDIEIAVFRTDQLETRSHLSGWEFTKVNPDKGHRREKWPPGEYLTLPIHEIHASSPNHDPGELEILLNEQEVNVWIFRRNPLIRLPLTKTGLYSRDGIPFLCPEIVLLYKAQKPKHIDEVDFFHTYKFLDDERRLWLAEALRICHPGHPWLILLSNSGQ